ncbi:MAG: hypothetical protein IKW35_05040 [Paludibacteraceae bacterium]|nr:hypothetical protein [Paludibacteraceae bacterium]
MLRYCLLACLMLGCLLPAQAQNEASNAKERTKPHRRNRLVLFDNDLRAKELLTDSATLDTVAAVQADSVHMADSTAIRVAFLLPLHADAVKRDKHMDRFYDFYAGALIAIYEKQQSGQAMEIFTYDIGKTALRTSEVLQQHPEIRQAHAVVGPAYAQQVEVVLDSLQEDSVWVMIPFLSRVKNIESHLFVLKFNPSEQIEADTLARYLAQRADSVNCVLVEAKAGEVIPSGIKALHQALKEHQVPTSSVSLKAILTDSIEGAFLPEKENIVVFNTERYANLQTVMPHLLKACGNYRITLFSHYSWQSEKIILPQLYTSVFTPQPAVSEEYEWLFEQYFDHELSSYQPRYDLLGYDLTNQLLDMLILQKSSQDNTVMLQDVWTGTQANIHYQPTDPKGGYENHIVHIIHQ